MSTMLKAAVLKKYQKFWIKRSSLRKNGSLELPVHEEYSTLRLLCESLLSEKDKAAMDEIVLDDLMERTVDSNAEATCTRLVAILKDKTSGFLPNSYLGDGSTPLHVVTKARFSDCVRVLIQHDANVNAVHLQLGHSVLHVAAMVGCYQSMNHLLNAGANRTYVNLLPGRHRSALHYAAERGSAPCLLMLLNPSQGSQVRRNEEVKEVRAVLDLPDAFGNTALHLACVDGSEECVRILIEAGASVAVRNVEGKTAVDVARTMAAGGASPSASAVLFMVLTAAGLDPLSQPLPAADDDVPSSAAAAPEPDLSLLDDTTSSSHNSSNKTVVYSSGEPALWVIVKDGLLIASEVEAQQSSGPAAAGANRKPPDVSKLSKRLRFVRRSIIGGSIDEPTEEPVSQQRSSAPARQLSVEVFRSREEAEERVRAVHHPSALASAASSSGSVPGGSSAQASTPLRTTATPTAGAGMGGSTPWGSAQRRGSSGGGSSSAGTGAPLTPARSEPAASEFPPSPVIAADGAPPSNIAFQTAHIDERHLQQFRATVPHFFPNAATTRQASNSTAYSSVRPQVPLVMAGGVRPVHAAAGAAEQEDPMWAEFKRTRSASTAAGASAHASNSRSEEPGKFGDTSLSNRPVKLQRAGSSVRASDAVPSVISPPSTPAHQSTAVPAAASSSSSSPPSTSAATNAPALPSPKSLLARKVALAAECLSLGTDIAALNAQIFERMCLLEELQARKSVCSVPDTVADAAVEEPEHAQDSVAVSLLMLDEHDESDATAQAPEPGGEADSTEANHLQEDGLLRRDDEADGDGQGGAEVPQSVHVSAQITMPALEGGAAASEEEAGESATREGSGEEEEQMRVLDATEAAAALERSNQLMLDEVTLSMQAELEGAGEEGWEARLQDGDVDGYGAEDREYGSEGERDSTLQWDAQSL